jgi:hypothetical protein
MEKVVIDTIDRITKLMDKHWDAKGNTELTDEEKDEARSLLERLQDFMVLKIAMPEQLEELGITQKEVMIINTFAEWSNFIGIIDEE